jgi:hypothetical protein
MLYNGTDEATVVLLAKALLSDKGLRPAVSVLLSDERIKAKIMPFEDRELEENYTNLMNVIGLESASYNKADYVLAIYSEADNHYDLDLESTEMIMPDISRKFYDFVVNVNQAIRAKKQVQFVDLLYPNGGSWDVISAFDYNKFLGYSAWNTASNSLGSALATIAVSAYANKSMKSFLYERIIDDCLYQTYSRREVNVMLLKDYVNIYDLNELQAKEALFLIKDNLKSLVKKYLKVDFNITLPWARTFEIDIDVEVE